MQIIDLKGINFSSCQIQSLLGWTLQQDTLGILAGAGRTALGSADRAGLEATCLLQADQIDAGADASSAQCLASFYREETEGQ